MDQERRLESLVYIHESPIHGRGAFAKTRIAEGEFIGRYEGTPAFEDAPHVLWVESETGWDGVHGENDLRFLNHSSDPNAEFEGQDLYALRDIQPGEEITFHYGEEWNDVP